MEAVTIQKLLEATKGNLLFGSIDNMITNVCINSREAAPGSLFIPLVGERTDGHSYIEDAIKRGAVCVLTSRPQTGWSHPQAACIQVRSTLSALQAFAAWYRLQFTIPIIGITGSVGKTTTKEMVAAALSSKLNVWKTAGNQNSQVGLPLTLFGIEKKHEAAVIEMGMSEFGEMSKIAFVAKPDHAVMTNIGVSHIGNLGSQENIRSEKLHITDFFTKDSKLFINFDDPLLQEVRTKLDQHDAWPLIKPNVISYGLSDGAAFRAENIRTTGTCTDFTLQYPDGREEIHLQVLGLHNVRNALAALAAAFELGISPAAAKEGLAAYQPIAMRGTILEAAGFRIIDDSYNASPDSMKSGIDVLGAMPDARRRIAVLADVLELGEHSRQCHYEVGIYLAEYNRTHVEKIDILITIGTEAEILGAAVKAATIASSVPSVHNFQNNRDAAAFLKETVKEGDVILIKGSRSMHTDEIVTALQSS